jgi:PIN domain nuclease of toxin-antitoxin system
MVAALADTHAAVWYLFDDPRLSRTAKSLIEKTRASRRKIAVASVSLAELIYLVEKGRLPQSAYDDLRSALLRPEHVFIEVPLSGDVVDQMPRVLRSEVPDMPDRIIAATAVHLNVPVLSRDGRIRASNVPTIW